MSSWNQVSCPGCGPAAPTAAKPRHVLRDIFQVRRWLASSKHELLLNWNFSISIWEMKHFSEPQVEDTGTFLLMGIWFLIKLLVLWEACFFSTETPLALNPWQVLLLFYQGHIWLILKDAITLGTPHGIHSTTRSPALWKGWQEPVSPVWKSILLLNVSASPRSLLLREALTGSGDAQGFRGWETGVAQRIFIVQSSVCQQSHLFYNKDMRSAQKESLLHTVKVVRGSQLTWMGFGAVSGCTEVQKLVGVLAALPLALSSVPPWGLVAFPWAAQVQVAAWAAKPPRSKFFKGLGVMALCSNVISVLGLHQLSFTLSWRLHWAISLPPSGSFQSPAENKNLERKRGFLKHQSYWGLSCLPHAGSSENPT